MISNTAGLTNMKFSTPRSVPFSSCMLTAIPKQMQILATSRGSSNKANKEEPAISVVSAQRTTSGSTSTSTSRNLQPLLIFRASINYCTESTVRSGYVSSLSICKLRTRLRPRSHLRDNKMIWRTRAKQAQVKKVREAIRKSQIR